MIRLFRPVSDMSLENWPLVTRPSSFDAAIDIYQTTNHSKFQTEYSSVLFYFYSVELNQFGSILDNP